MNAEYINPFVKGAQNILNTLCNEKISLGNLFLKKYPYTTEEISIWIGIIGEIKGNVIYNLKEEAACNIASKMMMGMPVEKLDAMSTSAISELANMISGNVATIFSGKGIIIDITTPKFSINANTEFFDFMESDSNLVCVPLSFENGDVFEIDILLERTSL